ncbi:MAG: glycerophosphoryl diester phosphodiesterase membrane domain-containing protein [Anaerotignum sp.]|nr:glycerophosphoryl diester phosphodiesterase membrane domain-containing protein [Anaerotignum sp.]
MLEAINKKELKVIEILSIAMHLFTKNLKSIMVVVAMFFFPISILNALIMEKLSNSLVLIKNFMDTGVITENLPGYTAVMLNFIENNLLQMAVLLFLEPIGVIAIAKITKSHLYSEQMNVKEAIGEAINCLWSVIITGIPGMILIFLGCLLFFIPGIYLGIIWTFYVYAIALRGKKGWKALEYSKKLTKGKFWKTIGLLIVISFIAAGWNWVFSGVYLFLPQQIGTDILYTVLTYISGSFSYIAMTVLFMNREAFLLGETYGSVAYVSGSIVNEDENE